MMTEAPVAAYAVVVVVGDGNHISYGPFDNLDKAKEYAINFPMAQTYPIYAPTIH
jgi:hypothetical protein